MFFEHDLTYSASSNRHLGLNEEESEAARLRNMVRESIMKVERENMDSIRKEVLNQKTATDSKNIVNISKKNISKVSVNKSSVFLKKGPISLHAKSPESKQGSCVNSSSLPSKPVFQTATSSCPFSNIHFLNHFQSSYLSAKPANKIKCGNEFDDCLCLDPSTDPIPSWKHVPERLYRKDDRSIPVVQNTKRIYKNLTVQALPSISINGQNTNVKRNILMEDIKEEGHSAENCVKTTILPSEPQEKKIGFQIKQTQNNVFKGSSTCTDKSVQVSGQPKKSAFTQSSDDLKEVTDYKKYVKELVREALNEFQLESYQGLHTGSQEKEARIIPHNNDCELDSFIGNVVPNLCDENCLRNKEITKDSISTQTSFDTEHMVLDKAQMRDLMKDFLHEYKLATSVDTPEKPLIPGVNMSHKEVQTDMQDSGSSQNVSIVSKGVQASPLPDNPDCDQASDHVINQAVPHDIEHSDKMTDTSTLCQGNNCQSTLHQPITTNSLSSPPLFSSELSTRLEFMINGIYEHFCKSNLELAVTSSKLSETISPVATIDTSVQLDPISTTNKSTCTCAVAQANAANQCEPPLPHIIDKKNASVQAEYPVSLQQKVDSSVQCDQSSKASKDACTQTFESFNMSFHSEHSAGTSVSSTPVSDSMFMDDMLSEGEVFLPWNLRLLSHADKSHPQSSSNIATEESCSSDREKDYSLSEGEIPPNYLLQKNFMTSPYDSGSDTCASSTLPQNTSILCQRSPFDPIHIHPSSIESSCHCQSSTASMSEGEVRNINSPSEGEITMQCFPNRYQSVNTTVRNEGQETNLPNQSDMSTRVCGSEASHSGLNTRLHVSEGEIGRRIPAGILNTPRGLFTVREEK